MVHLGALKLDDQQFATARQRLLDHQSDTREMRDNRRRQERAEHLENAAWSNLDEAILRCLKYHSKEDVQKKLNSILSQ